MSLTTDQAKVLEAVHQHGDNYESTITRLMRDNGWSRASTRGRIRTLINRGLIVEDRDPSLSSIYWFIRLTQAGCMLSGLVVGSDALMVPMGGHHWRTTGSILVRADVTVTDLLKDGRPVRWLPNDLALVSPLAVLVEPDAIRRPVEVRDESEDTVRFSPPDQPDLWVQISADWYRFFRHGMWAAPESALSEDGKIRGRGHHIIPLSVMVGGEVIAYVMPQSVN